MSSLVALIPMRHHSQRVPGKNYRLLAGKPLFHYIIETLLEVPEIDKLVVDTDSELIMDGLKKHFSNVIILERPENLRADETPTNDILLHDTAQVKADFYLQTHTTNPLLRPKTISKAIEMFLAHYPEKDSLFSVSRWQTRLYDEHGVALNHDPTVLLQTQELPPVYEENSCLYLFTRKTLLERHHRIGAHPILFEINPDEARDIDEELDFEIAGYFIQGNK